MNMSRPDTALDLTIRQLLDQQADIQARLNTLLPARYALDAPLELRMLRHKLRVLESLVDRHNLNTRIPVLAEADEARSLQYRCECLEVTLLQENLDVAEALRLSSHDQAPPGHGPWLDQHLGYCDPIVRNWLLRDDISPRDNLQSSFKCRHQGCIHYVYGLSTRAGRDEHEKLHDEFLRVVLNNVARHDATSHSHHSALASPAHLSSAALPKSLPPVRPPRQAVFKPQQPALNLSIPSNESGHLAPAGLNMAETRPNLVRNAPDSGHEQHLPRPLKRTRIGPSPQDRTPNRASLSEKDCLRCKLFRRQCDLNQPCWTCSQQLVPDRDGHWQALGCFRGSIRAFVDILLPGPLSPRQTQTPLTSPLSQRQNINEYLSRAYPYPPVHGSSQPKADFEDGFWWSEDLNSRNDSSHQGASSRTSNGLLPPILQAISSSLNSRSASYSLLDLIAVSSGISSSRQREQTMYPVLYYAKLLLREIAYYDVLQPTPALQTESTTQFPLPPDAATLVDQSRVLHECTLQFLQAFESFASNNGKFTINAWLAIFISLCIFSAVRTLLIDIATISPRGQAPPPFPGANNQTNPYEGIHSVYYVLVDMFATSAGSLLESESSMEEDLIAAQVNRVVRQESWPLLKISSSLDFLMTLGRRGTGGFDAHAFLRPTRLERPPAEPVVLPPILRTGHSPRRSVPNIGSLLDVGRPRVGSFAKANGSALHHNLSDQITSPPEEYGRARRHTVGEGTSITVNPSTTISSPISPRYQRTTSVRRVYCTKCNENPEGFRGEHELRRHNDAKHAAMIKQWVCVEPNLQNPGTPQPAIPLSKCKACIVRKPYGAYYNAAAHLRRAHFNPHKGSKASGDWPSMTILKDWMMEVRHSGTSQDVELSSDGEDMEPNSATEYYAPDTTLSPMMPPVRIPRLPTASPSEIPWSSSTVPNSATRVPENRTRCPHPDCGRVFKDLAAHMLTHQEERPEKCPIESCEYHTKGFARKYDKNRHALTHYKGTMVCPFCPGTGTAFEKAFNRADVFKRHLTAVHNVDQSAPNSRRLINSTIGTGNGAGCSICQYEFATAQDFYEHLDDCVLNVIVPSQGIPGSSKVQQQPQGEALDATPPIAPKPTPAPLANVSSTVEKRRAKGEEARPRDDKRTEGTESNDPPAQEEEKMIVVSPL